MKSTTRRQRIAAWTAVVAAMALGACSSEQPGAATHVVESPAATDRAPVAVAASDLRFERFEDPARTVVQDASGRVVATFTDRSRTVVIEGPERTFDEPSSTDATVTTRAWVRLAPRPWSKGAEKQPWFEPWFSSTVTSTKPDVLAIAFEYVEGAPAHSNEDGLRVSGDASFGPVGSDGPERLRKNDFYDYLGVSWQFPDVGREQPERRRYGSLDCSGFVRMVIGYRLGYPLRGSNTPGSGLPRRAFAIEKYGPGVQVVKNRERTATDYAAVQPGDLLFFQLKGGPQIDHMGIYLGLDSNGQHRFISSRNMANGPTMGDVGGLSVLDGVGVFSRGFRAARRV